MTLDYLEWSKFFILSIVLQVQQNLYLLNVSLSKFPHVDEQNFINMGLVNYLLVCSSQKVNCNKVFPQNLYSFELSEPVHILLIISLTIN